MSEIRRKSIRGTLWIYMGFLIGALNVYLMTKAEWFSPTEYGLTNVLRDISLLVAGISTFGLSSVIIKFFPYYQDNIAASKNDLLGYALKFCSITFTITALVMLLMKPLVVRKLAGNSMLLVENFYFTLLMGFSILLYTLLEAYAYGWQKGIFLNFLKEFALRVFILVLIVLRIFNVISFQTFVVLFSVQYFFILIILTAALHRNGELNIVFKTSNVTRKFRKKIQMLILFSALVVIVGVLRSTIDSVLLASRRDLAAAGFFSFSVYLISLLQAPYRSLVAIVLPILSRSWKEKRIKEIRKIYRSSSINLLSFALLGFGLIYLNFDEAIKFLGINEEYLQGKPVLIITGIMTIMELGTGVNSQILGTSTAWRFEFLSNVIFTLLVIPLSYYFTVQYGLIGPALGNLIAYIFYNVTRYLYLKRKYNLSPFSMKTVEVLCIFCFAFLLGNIIIDHIKGLQGMLLTSLVYCAVFLPLFYFRNISPDTKPLLSKITGRYFN